MNNSVCKFDSLEKMNQLYEWHNQISHKDK